MLQCYRTGAQIPEKFKNPPEIELGNELYFTAFNELSNERENGFGIGKLRWSSIAAYCGYLELDEDLSSTLHYVVRKMDDVYVEVVNEKRSKGSQ